VLRIRAALVYPVTAPPIEDGAVLIDDAGHIAAVGPHAHIAHPAPNASTSLEFPDAMLTPGLVNCHTHLELTHLAGQNPERDFAAWIRRIRELKDATPPEAFVASARQGLHDCWRHGVTTVADTGSTGAALRVLASAGGRGIAYQEVFGPDPRQADASLADLETALAALAPCAGPRVRLGVSPHAPYTVSEPLYRAVANLAQRRRLPVAVHLAESEAETQFVRDGTGPFAEAHRARGIPIIPRRRSPVQYLAELGSLSRNTLCIHCVQLDAQDVAVLAGQGAAVAHCPRSNAAHGHGRAPAAALREAGVRVGLGTDSLVSVEDADVWAEARAAGLHGEDALRALTIEGARALGLDGEVGSLEVGKAGDVAVFPSSALVRRGPPSLLTVLAGRIVHDVHS
jgi:5-methylthioadenosine/S-adenosylhomocysteine deaminase